MTIRDLRELTGAELLNAEESMNEGREIESAYCCDLLSWVMTQGRAGMVWITVQTHMNVVAVATLLDLACVIVPEGIEVPQATLDKAAEEGIPVLGSKRTAYQLSGMLYEKGVQSPGG